MRFEDYIEIKQYGARRIFRICDLFGWYMGKVRNVNRKYDGYHNQYAKYHEGWGGITEELNTEVYKDWL